MSRRLFEISRDNQRGPEEEPIDWAAVPDGTVEITQQQNTQRQYSTFLDVEFRILISLASQDYSSGQRVVLAERFNRLMNVSQNGLAGPPAVGASPGIGMFHFKNPATVSRLTHTGSRTS